MVCLKEHMTWPDGVGELEAKVKPAQVGSEVHRASAAANVYMPAGAASKPVANGPGRYS